MKTSLLVVLLLACAPGLARADRWTPVDSGLELVVMASLAADYVQTVRICRDPIVATHEESNPVMGPTGQRVPPEAYFATVAVAHAVVARVLPQPWRRISQGLMFAVQIKSVTHNWEAGYAIRF